MKYLFILFLLFNLPCYALNLQTQRGIIDVNDGDFVGTDRFYYIYKGDVIKGLKNVTFKKWKFTQAIPHTKLFQDCTGLRFIKCNLINVDIPDDAVIEDSLTFHKREYENLGVKYQDVECKDNKTRTYIIDETPIDLVRNKLKEMGLSNTEINIVYDKVKSEMIARGETVETINKKIILLNTEETNNDKKYNLNNFIK